ncbi:MAG: acyloxyacyl hydrolase [Rikenellaceae bacterium]
MRLKKIALLTLLAASLASAKASDTTPQSAPSYVAIGTNVGTVLPTCDFFSGDYAIPVYGSESIKYIFTSPGDKWQQIAYGMPYYGIGVTRTQFGRPDQLGNPISLYLVQGATMRTFSSRGMLNYELNLGLSTGWVPYDPFDNRDNIAIGSVMNVHVAANVYYKWIISNTLDLHMGATLFHASNGSSRQPNHGINTLAGYFELAYNFDREQQISRYAPHLRVPEFEPHFEHDVQMILSSTNRKINIEEDGVPNGLNDKDFNVYGLNYYSMHTTSYRYKYGAGVELLYDESSNADIYRKYNEIDEMWYEVTDLAPLRERLSLGVAVRGEIVRPLYSIFASIGYSLIQPNDSMSRLYQSVGVKVPLQNNLYGTFGVRATSFSEAQFLYWSLGYTLNRK